MVTNRLQSALLPLPLDLSGPPFFSKSLGFRSNQAVQARKNRIIINTENVALFSVLGAKRIKNLKQLVVNGRKIAVKSKKNAKCSL